MKNKHYHTIRNIDLSTRLQYSFILISVVPLLIFAIISYHVSNKAILNKVSNYSVQTLKAVSKNIQYECNKYKQVADSIMLNSRVRKGLLEFENMDYLQKNQFIINMNQIMSTHLSNLPNIMQIYLIDKNNVPIYNQGWFYFSTETIEKLIGFSKEGINWLSINEANTNYVTYIQPIFARNGGNILGYILININSQALYDCISDVNLGVGANLIIVDSFGRNVISQENKFKVGEQIDQALFKRCLKQSNEEIIQDYKLHGKTNMIAHIYNAKQGWTFLAVIPNKYLRSETNYIGVNMLISIILCILCAAVVFRETWKSIVNPLNRLVQLVGEAVNSNFDQVIVDDSNDELGYLGRTFGLLVRKMQDLISQVKDEQIKQRESELKMLQAQINPHFLFNTLNSLRWTAMMSGANSVSDGLSALSSLLSNTIVDKNQFITIEDELKNVENYIAIQRIRYGDIFTVNYDIDEPLRRCYMIKFLLQPIVENAIIHGLDENTTKNCISISIKSKDKKVVVIIRDNGKGFNVEEALEIKKEKQFLGFGIRNVQERINLCFGKEYLFSIDSKLNQGTTVTIEFPLLIQQPDEKNYKDEVESNNDSGIIC